MSHFAEFSFASCFGALFCSFLNLSDLSSLVLAHYESFSFHLCCDLPCTHHRYALCSFRPFLYVQVLLLTAQYTSALEYISRSAEIDPSDAVHLVILQYYYGLIDTGDPPMDDDEIPKAATLPDLLWR